MLKTLTVRGVTLGAGRAKIIVPVSGQSAAQAVQAVRQAAQSAPDLIEWRADQLTDADDPAVLLPMLAEVRAAAGEHPLLFTYRTQAEGGDGVASGEDYARLLQTVAQSGLVDLIDVEVLPLPSAWSLVRSLQEAGVPVVASSHDFTRTPPLSTLMGRMRAMQGVYGADVAKLAVTPRCPEDVLTLLQASARFTAEGRIPCITISMGAQGAVSRACGSLFGSAATFASAGQASAPGQMDIEPLRQVLALLEPN